MYSLRTRVTHIAVALSAGIVLAVIGPLTGKFENVPSHVAALVFSSGWAWACFAFFVGYSIRSKIESVLLSSSALAVAVAVYYVFKFIFPTSSVGQIVSSGPGGELASRILIWGIAAFVLGGPLGLLGNIARTPGIGGVPFRLLVPLIAFVETSLRLDAEASSQGLVAEVTWTAVRITAGGAFLVLLVHGVVTWRAGRDESETGTAAAPASRFQSSGYSAGDRTNAE